MKRYIIIFALIIAAVLLSVLLHKTVKENNRLKNNFEIEVKRQLNTQQTITKSELKEYFSEDVATLKEHDVKLSQIENIIKVKYHYVDTLIRKDTLIYTYDTIQNAQSAQFSVENGCYSVFGNIIGNCIEINRMENNDTLLISLYKEKRKCLFKQRRIKAIAIAKCSNDTVAILRNLRIEK
jgi:uncharacterized protein HemX